MRLAPLPLVACLCPVAFAVAACNPQPDPTTAQVDKLEQAIMQKTPPLEQQEKSRQGVLARISGPDVVRLAPHSDVPKVPDAVRGLRVLLADKIVRSHIKPTGADPLGGDKATEEQTKSGCAKTGMGLLEQIGWIAVLDASQPHDLVLRSDCTGNAAIATVDGAMYVLLPSAAGQDGMRFETPAGELVDQFPKAPTTLACPVADEAKCAEAVKEWAVALVVGEVAASTKLGGYATRLRATAR